MADLAEWRGAATEAVRAVGALPAHFLILLLLNLVFLGMVLWFLTAQMELRTNLVGKIVDACIAQSVHPAIADRRRPASRRRRLAARRHPSAGAPPSWR
jgi:hypothetical protein